MTEYDQRVDLTPILLAGVVGLAVALRVIYLVELSSTPFFRHPVLDAQYYLTWAGKLAWGGVRFSPEFQGNPLYPYFLAFLIRFAHAGPLLIRIVQHGLGIATCYLIFRAGRALFNEKIGLLAAFLYAIYIPALFYEGWFLSASLTSFLTAALIATLLAPLESRRPGHWVGSGIIGGLLTLSRPSLLPVGALLWLLASFRGRRNGHWQGPLLFLAGLLIIVAPSFLYLSLSRHEPVFVSFHGGENFYIGNNPEATGVSRIPDFARGNPALQHEDFRREAERRTGQSLTPGENSRFWFREGVRFIVAHPLLFLKLLLLKIFFFFNANAFSDNYHLPFFQDQLWILRFPFSWRALSTLGILGMIAGWKRRKSLALLYILTVSYIISLSLFFVTARLRLPAAPLLALFGAYGVSSFFHAIKQREKKAVAGLGLIAVMVFIGLGRHPKAMPLYASYLSAGEVYYRDGEYHQALSYLKKAREAIEETTSPNRLRTYRIHYALGQAYLGMNEPGRAEEEFSHLKTEGRNGLLEPDFDIGNAYAGHRFYQQAKKHFQAVLRETPDHYRAWNNLGMVYKEEGDLKQAAAAFQAALELNPDHAPAHTNLGNLYVGEEKYEAALNEFRAALRIDPGLVQLHLSSAFCLQQLNRLSEAEVEMQRCPSALRKGR